MAIKPLLFVRQMAESRSFDKCALFFQPFFSERLLALGIPPAPYLGGIPRDSLVHLMHHFPALSYFLKIDALFHLFSTTGLYMACRATSLPTPRKRTFLFSFFEFSPRGPLYCFKPPLFLAAATFPDFSSLKTNSLPPSADSGVLPPLRKIEHRGTSVFLKSSSVIPHPFRFFFVFRSQSILYPCRRNGLRHFPF